MAEVSVRMRGLVVLLPRCRDDTLFLCPQYLFESLLAE